MLRDSQLRQPFLNGSQLRLEPRRGAVQSATGLGDNVSVSVGTSYCGCQNGTTYTAQAYAPPCNVCGNFVTTDCCPAGQTAVTLAQVNATYNYKPLFNYLGFGPSNGYNLSAQATAMLY